MRQRPQNSLRGNSNFCFLLLNGKSLTVTWALAVAMTWLLACNSLGLGFKINLIILFPTLEWTHLTLCGQWSSRGGPPSSGAPGTCMQQSANSISFRYDLASLWNDSFRASFAVLVFICSLFSLAQKVTVVSNYCSAWDLTLIEGFKWTLSVFWFRIIRQILPMQLPSIWRYRTPEPSKRSKRLELPSGVRKHSIVYAGLIWFH